jgi:hypothetical protein
VVAVRWRILLVLCVVQFMLFLGYLRPAAG